MAETPSLADAEKQQVDGQKDPDPLGIVGTVLLGNKIEEYIDKLNPPLIVNVEKKHIGPASYDLRLGDEYYQDGHFKELTDKDRYITIQPHGMVVVSTHEILHLPRYLIGRWNLRVGLVYKGLLWAGGPQVDPGYYGHLFCPLYNLSSTTVLLERRQHIVTIDFVKTTPYDQAVASRNENWIFKVTKHKLAEYIPGYVLKSSIAGLQTQLDESVSKFENRQKENELKTTSDVKDLQSTVLIGLSIVFAGLTIVATLPWVAGAKLNLPPPDWVTLFYLSFSTASLIISIFAINRTRRR